MINISHTYTLILEKGYILGMLLRIEGVVIFIEYHQQSSTRKE